MGAPMAPLHLILTDLESQTQVHPDFEALYFAKEPS